MALKKYNTMAVNNIAESRVGGLGGSDAAMVRKAATSRLTDTDIKRLLVMVGRMPYRGFAGNAATQAGYKFEEEVAEWFKSVKMHAESEHELTAPLSKHFKTFAHADFWHANTGTVYECKYSQKPTQEVIRHYYAQLQWYYLLGAKTVKLVHGTGSVEPFNVETLDFIEIERDEDCIEELKQGLKNIEEYINSDDFKSIDIDADALVLHVDDAEVGVSAAMKELAEIKMRKKALEKREMELLEVVLQWRNECQDYRRVVGDGWSLSYINGYESKNFDSKKAIALLGDRAAECYSVNKVAAHNTLNLNDK